MAFFQKNNAFDLGELHIENLFISDMMPMASGTNVKVYLLGLMFSQSSQDDYRFDNRILAQQLQLPLQDVLEAWQYWESLGVIKKHLHDDGVSFDVEFLSLRALYIQNNYISKAASSPQRTKKESFQKKNEIYSKLSKEVEQIIGHPLSHGDYRAISDFYDHYYSNSDIILKAVSLNYKERNIRNMKAVKKLLTSWTEAGLLTIEEIEQFITASDERYTLYKEVLKLLGLSYRMPNQAEKEMIDHWTDTLNFEKEELLKFIYFFSKKNSNLSLNYLEKAFDSLSKEDIKTLDAYEVKLSERVKEKPQRNAKKQVTIEKERSYSDEELEAMLLKKRRSK